MPSSHITPLAQATLAQHASIFTHPQVLYSATGDLSSMEYDTPEDDELPATLHDMANVEVEGTWARFW